MFESFNNRYVVDVTSKLLTKSNGSKINRFYITSRTAQLKLKLLILLFLFFAEHWADYAVQFLAISLIAMYEIFSA